jgi:uncharacterized membrane protein YdjX (TVP38/TMEM64 family)
MPDPERRVAPRKLPIIKLVVAGVILAIVAVVVLRGVDVRALIDRGMALIRDAGPWAFFSAMTVLPAVGAPMLAFTIPAGEAFAARMGLGWVIVVSLAAVAVNLALSYWIARYALRPLVAGLVKRYGYSVPRITPDNALGVLLVVRLTPGPPYPLQCYVLGIAEAPFRLYMIVSWLALMPWVLGAIILGRGLFNGNFKVAATGVGVLVVAIVAVQWIRRKYTRSEK